MLRETQRVFGTPIPSAVTQAARAWAPGPPAGFAMDCQHEFRFADDALDRPRAGAGLASRLLYMRSHWMRMPLTLLVRHLSTKALRRLRERFERGDDDEERMLPGA